MPSLLSRLLGNPGPPATLNAGQMQVLRRFREAYDVAPLYKQAEFWTQVGGMHPRDLVKHFAKSRLLVPAGPQAALAACLSSAQLSDLCRKRGLPVSGTKAAKAERLTAADAKGMQHLIHGREVYICTEAGLALVQEDINREDRLRAQAEAAVVAALEARDFRRAARLVAAYEAKQPIPRGLGIDWAHHDTSGEEEALRVMYSSRPGILTGLTDVELDRLRLVAAQMLLWGRNRAREWAPDPKRPYGRFDVDTAARMLVFYTNNRRWLADARASQLQHRVKILSAIDSCPVCRKLSGTTYAVNRVPELPNPGCTHDKGCRCSYIADLD